MYTKIKKWVGQEPRTVLLLLTLEITKKIVVFERKIESSSRYL